MRMEFSNIVQGTRPSNADQLVRRRSPTLIGHYNSGESHP